MADEKEKRALRIQTGRFKRILNDVRMYKLELVDFEKQRVTISSNSNDPELDYNLRHLDNQIEETNLVLASCYKDCEAAQNDLYMLMVSYPSRSEDIFKDAVTVYQRSVEVDLPFDEDMIAD